jgi:putative N-acetylmannosamine-6-phosphate epimerase
MQGTRVLRLQGQENIVAVRRATGLVSIGLIKRDYEGSDVYITPTKREVQEVIDAGSEIVAIDGTARQRPQGASLASCIALAHSAGRLVLADIDSLENARYSVACGADMLSTTLSGYTPSPSPLGPDLELLRALTRDLDVPIFAEGRYDAPWQVDAAIHIGAYGVIVGGAINDPEKNTRRFAPRPRIVGKVGAVDIGGTWLRFATFSDDWKLLDCERIPNPPVREARLEWIRSHVKDSGVLRVGLSTGGIVDPRTGQVWKAKEYLMPDHIGIVFDESTLGVSTFAHGDGHATAWGHACLPQFAGRRVATLALGTGVGCGFVADGKIWSGRRGEYPRINDLPGPEGNTYEGLLGGINISRMPDLEQQRMARLALSGALYTLRNLYFPDDIVVAGSVGMSDWMRPELESQGVIPSPFGADAGLFGAAALALFPHYL